MVDDGDDGVEDMYDDSGDETKVVTKAPTGGGNTEDPVALVFPTCDREEKDNDDKWKWSVCGGLIGGAKGGNRFASSLCRTGSYGHCGVGSHT